MSIRRDLTYQVIGINNSVSVKHLDDDPPTIWNWKAPTNITIEEGIATQETMGRDKFARNTTLDRRETEAKPKAKLIYSGANLELLAVQRGRKLESGSFDVIQPYQIQVQKGTYDPVPTGKLGYGIAADDPTVGAYTLTDTVAGPPINAAKKSQPLTQQPFATFNSATLNSFAVGANMALKFSDDIVTDKRIITLAIDRTVVGNRWSSAKLGALSISAQVVMSDDRVGFLHIYNGIVDSSGIGFDPTSENLEITLDLITPPEKCFPYLLVESSEVVYCQ